MGLKVNLEATAWLDGGPCPPETRGWHMGLEADTLG